MSKALSTALSKSRGFVASKAIESAGITPEDIGLSLFGDNRQQARNRERYGLFRGWLYAAIDARACEAAGQPVTVARMTNAEPNPEERSAPSMQKHQRNKLQSSIACKAAESELEIIVDHPLIDALAQPNSIQTRWQFVYNFFANLDLTGWSYVVKDEDVDGRPVFFSLPTTWVRPDHTNGPFTGFKIVNPKNAASAADAKTLGRDQVAFAYYPNPADPLAGYAPSAAQGLAIRIDDHIQTSQEAFFENGIFPSMIVTVGKNPGPSGQEYRPRLSQSQRETVYAAIAKVNGGLANYGNPAIIDGLIESFERMSATSNEMGWEKSEDKVKTRILSAFRVHPYILGEHVSIGGHAQVSAIEKRFCSGVNTGLDLLSNLMTNFLGPTVAQDDRIIISWDKCTPVDEQLRQQGMLSMRANSDITQNEIRAEFGMPPDRDTNQDFLGKNSPQVIQTLNLLGNGGIDRDQAIAVFVGMGIPDDMAEDLAGEEKPPQPNPFLPQPPPAIGGPMAEDEESEETTEDAIDVLETAVAALGINPKTIANRIVETSK